MSESRPKPSTTHTVRIVEHDSLDAQVRGQSRWEAACSCGWNCDAHYLDTVSEAKRAHEKSAR